MILDVTELGLNSLVSDLCIVGAGAAGLTLAAALSHTRTKIVILEAGGPKRSALAQAFYQGEVSGNHPAAHEFRVRALGGTSTIWGGGCVPLDPMDFMHRPWVPESGWPMEYSHILPFYRQALDAAEAGAFAFDAPSPLIDSVDGEAFRTSLERFSRPTNFWKRWRPILKKSENIRVVLNAAAIDIRLKADGRNVDHILAAAPDGRRFRVRALNFVLAVGGLETARLLLASNKDHCCGVGNQSGWVGRGYMCHTAAVEGVVTLAGGQQSARFGHERDGDGVYYRRRLLLTERAQRDRRILNLAFRLRPLEESDPIHGDAILSSLHLAKALFCRGRKCKSHAHERPPDTRGHLSNIIGHPMRAAGAVGMTVWQRYLGSRKAPGVAFRSAQNCYALEFNGEQAVNPDSRVSLGAAQDRFGMLRLRIDWRSSSIDIETIKHAYKMLADRFRETRAGRLDYSADRLVDRVKAAGAYGGHHIGTARMSKHPNGGVVNAKGAVHGFRNLYICGAATMPTSGQANPTLTVLALAYQLAAHLCSGSV